MANKHGHNVFLSFLLVVGLLVGAFLLLNWATDWLYRQSPAVIFVVGAGTAILAFEILKSFIESRND